MQVGEGETLEPSLVSNFRMKEASREQGQSIEAQNASAGACALLSKDSFLLSKSPRTMHDTYSDCDSLDVNEIHLGEVEHEEINKREAKLEWAL